MLRRRADVGIGPYEFSRKSPVMLEGLALVDSPLKRGVVNTAPYKFY